MFAPTATGSEVSEEQSKFEIVEDWDYIVSHIRWDDEAKEWMSCPGEPPCLLETSFLGLFCEVSQRHRLSG